MSQDGEIPAVIAGLKDWGALLGASLGAIIGWILARRRDNAEARSIEMQSDLVISDLVTSRLKTLIDGYEKQISGYEKRVAELTAEVRSLHEEVRELRNELARRNREQKIT
jgi:predicted RNase H-like nuclease (RuvC/YqgF family)